MNLLLSYVFSRDHPLPSLGRYVDRQTMCNKLRDDSDKKFRLSAIVEQGGPRLPHPVEHELTMTNRHTHDIIDFVTSVFQFN